MALEEGFRKRLFRRFKAFQGEELRDVTHAEIGMMVADILGRKPIPQSTVSRWFTDSVPDLDTIAALAETLRADPGWLAFGERSRAPEPKESLVVSSGGPGADIVTEPAPGVKPRPHKSKSRRVSHG